LYGILRRLRFQNWPACAGALLFALHSLQVEPVAWVTALKDILYGFFSLLAIFVYVTASPSADLPYAQGREQLFTLRYIVATVLFLLALLSKVTAIAVPLVLLSLTMLNPELLPPGKTARRMGIWLLLSVPFVVLTKRWQPNNWDFVTAGWQRPLIASDALAFYLFKLFCPAHLLIDYGRTPQVIFRNGSAYWTWLFPAALAVFVWHFRTRARPVAVGAFIFAVLLTPVLGLFTFDFQHFSTTADRYIYLSMMGPAIAFAWVVEKGSGRTKLAAVFLLMALALRSSLQTAYWRNNYALYMHTAELNPMSALALENGSAELGAEGKFDQAIDFASRAKRLRPKSAGAYKNLALIYLKTGHIDKAVEEYRACYPLDKDDVRQKVIAACTTFGREGRTADGLLMGELAIELAPDDLAAHLDYGSVLSESGDYSGAQRELRRAVELDAKNVVAQTNLATILASCGNRSEAIEHYREALRLDPKQPAAAEGLKLLLGKGASSP
jgi:Flp pilus assembly protein TadD